MSTIYVFSPQISRPVEHVDGMFLNTKEECIKFTCSTKYSILESSQQTEWNFTLSTVIFGATSQKYRHSLTTACDTVTVGVRAPSSALVWFACFVGFTGDEPVVCLTFLFVCLLAALLLVLFKARVFSLMPIDPTDARSSVSAAARPPTTIDWQFRCGNRRLWCYAATPQISMERPQPCR